MDLEQAMYGPHFKPVMMTVFMHDYASIEPKGSWPLSTEKGRLQSVVSFTQLTMEGLRTMTNEQIGAFIRQQLEGIDTQKKALENR